MIAAVQEINCYFSEEITQSIIIGKQLFLFLPDHTFKISCYANETCLGRCSYTTKFCHFIYI